jgi:hypothetical protein
MNRYALRTNPEWVISLPDAWVMVKPRVGVDTIALRKEMAVPANLTVIVEPLRTDAKFDAAAFVANLNNGEVLSLEETGPHTWHLVASANYGTKPLIFEQKSWQLDNKLVTLTATCPAAEHARLSDETLLLLQRPEFVGGRV